MSVIQIRQRLTDSYLVDIQCYCRTRRLIINNLNDGSECYAMPNMTRLLVFPVPMSVLRPKQVTFDATWNFVIQGSDKGLVYIYNFDNAVMMQSLPHSPCACYPFAM